MGYYTDYKLEWSGEISVKEDCPHCGGTGKVLIEDPVKVAVQTELRCYQGTHTIESNLEDREKWYDHSEDMKKLSADFPDVLFVLHGEGEEAGDVWVKYYKNGRVQVEKVDTTLAEFDESKLE